MNGLIVNGKRAGCFFLIETARRSRVTPKPTVCSASRFRRPRQSRRRRVGRVGAGVERRISRRLVLPRRRATPPDKLLRSFRERLVERGVEFREGTTAERLKGNGAVAESLETERGPIEAKTFVVATGTWTPKWNESLGCRVPIQPGKGYSLTMSRPSICPKIPLIFPETRVAVTPFQSAYRIGSTMEFSGYDESIDPKRLELLKEGAAAVFARALDRGRRGALVRLAADDDRRHADHRPFSEI